MCANCGARAPPKYASMYMIDDKASEEEPHQGRAVGSMLKAFSRPLQGIVEEGEQLTSMITCDLWQGSKDSDSELHHIVQHALRHHRGEKIMICGRDCASLGFCATMLGALPVWLADHKIYDLVIVHHFLETTW